MSHGYSINNGYGTCRQDNARHVNQSVEAERNFAAQQNRGPQQQRTSGQQIQYRNNPAIRNRVQARIQKAVTVATAEYSKGVKETRENDSTQIRVYKYGMKNNWNWCSYFANYCYGKGQGNNRTLFGIDKDKVGRSQTVKKQAQAQGYFSNANSGYIPKVGDLAIWSNKKNSYEGHIGIVTKVYSDGSYEVTEGNKDDKVSVIKYNSQKASDTDTKTNRFAGFVRMEDYLYDLESGKITASLSDEEQSTDLYEKDDQSTMGYLG